MSATFEELTTRARASLPMRLDGVDVKLTNPTTGAARGVLVGGGAQAAASAAERACAAQDAWAATPMTARCQLLTETAKRLLDSDSADALATAITAETGKRIAEARAEVQMSAKYFQYFATLAALGEECQNAYVPTHHHTVRRRPLGVVAAVSSWNFPVSIPARKIAPALAAGCSVLFKPSEIAPVSGLLLTELLRDILPADVLQAEFGDAISIVDTWLDHTGVRGITFTGSTRVGTLIAAKAAATMTRCTLELGGSAPFVVLDDADVQSALDVLMVAKFRNNGQSCIAANSVWVPRQRLDEFVTGLRERCDAMLLGDPNDESTDLGPLATASDPARIERLILDAAASGGEIIRCGIAPGNGHYFAPAIVVAPAPTAEMVRGEVFGPAVSVLPYADLEEVITASRTSAYGLAAYVTGSDVVRAQHLAARLDSGLVGINTGTPNVPQVPFSGLKMSGQGAEGSPAGAEEFMTWQTVATAT